MVEQSNKRSIIPCAFRVAGEVEYLTDDHEVFKKVLISGDEGTWYQKGMPVLVDYEGRLSDKLDEIFDKSNFPEPLKVVMGEGKVIKGWEIGIASMKVGEKAEFTIGPNYAYGGRGQPPKIPEDATLVFKIELLQAGPSMATRWQKTDPQLAQAADKCKAEGAELYK